MDHHSKSNRRFHPNRRFKQQCVTDREQYRKKKSSWARDECAHVPEYIHRSHHTSYGRCSLKQRDEYSNKTDNHTNHIRKHNIHFITFVFILL